VVERIALKGLTSPEVGALIAATTGTAPPAEVVTAVQARTEGNPFFVAELTRLLHTEHDLSPAAVADVLPSGVRDVVRRRLARLPEETAAVLALAAVMGRRFELETLERAAGLDADRALELVEAALLGGLVSEDPETPERFFFSHDLVRETIAAEITATRRARLHARVGEAIEALHPDDPAHAVELAHHFVGAGRALPAERTVAHLVRAAEAEQGRLANEQAEGHLREALLVADRLPAGPARDGLQLDVLLRVVSLLIAVRGYASAEVAEVLERAQAVNARVADPRVRTRVLYGLVQLHLVGGRLLRARRLAERLLAEAPGLEGPVGPFVGNLAVGAVAVQQGEFEVAQAHLETAMGLTEAHEDPWLVGWIPLHPFVGCATFLGWCLSQGRDHERANDLIDRAVAFASARDQVVSTAHALHFAAWVAVLDRRPSGVELAERALVAAEDAGLAFYVAISRALHGHARAERGEVSLGMADLRQSLAELGRTGTGIMHTMYLGFLAEAQHRAGDPAGALASTEEALARLDPTGERFWEAELRRLHGELLVTVFPERRAEAEAELRQAVAIARTQGTPWLEDRVAESLGLVTSAPANQP